jgi:hypothetical protein
MTGDTLPFTIDLWAEDELSIERMLARAATLSIARAAFDTAAVTYPGRLVTLCGPGVEEERYRREGRSPAGHGTALHRPRRGWTSDPHRLAGRSA